MNNRGLIPRVFVVEANLDGIWVPIRKPSKDLTRVERMRRAYQEKTGIDTRIRNVPENQVYWS